MKNKSAKDIIVSIITNPLETILCCLMIALSIITFSQVIARYVFETPLSWSVEMARFLLMWLAMLSAAYAFKHQSHLALQFIRDRFSPPIQRIISGVIALVTVMFFIVFVIAAFQFVRGVEGYTAPALQIPMAIPYSSAVVGGVLMLYYSFITGWREVFRNQSEEKVKT